MTAWEPSPQATYWDIRPRHISVRNNHISAEAPNPAMPNRSPFNTKYSTRHTTPPPRKTSKTLQYKTQSGYCGISAREGRGLIGDPTLPAGFLRERNARPRFTQNKCSRQAWVAVWQRGVCLGGKADSWGGRLGWMGAALWHTDPGTEASTDGWWAGKLQGD